MLDVVTNVALALLGLSVALLFYWVLVGPTIPDRSLALDTIAVNVMAIILVLSIKLGTPYFLDAVLSLAVLGFVGTTALAKFLVKGVIIDRDRN
ncbi:hypothetical protein SY88_12165 [Clostridiales bacterium PH28_bin88]|nr:hypothetical protein SY88_12165 [Clostridiales bacterium PH28_bin88]